MKKICYYYLKQYPICLIFSHLKKWEDADKKIKKPRKVLKR